MGLCQYVDLCLHASSLPCLHTFWHAIPTSFYIFNVFIFFKRKALTSIKLTPAGMVDNLVEKVDECSLNHCNVYNWECKIITLYGVEWDVRYLRVSNALNL